MASAACALASVRKLGFAVSLHLCPKLFWQFHQAPQSFRIIELPQEPLVLVGQAHDRHRQLADQPLEFGKDRGINLDPFARNLKEHAAEGVIEGVFLAAHALETPAQNAFEVSWA